MTTNHHPDVRGDQLKLLKLERRELRSLATAVLSVNVSPATKRLAIAGAAAALMALHAAPRAYAEKINADALQVSPSAAAIAAACDTCLTLSELINAQSNHQSVFDGVARLFAIVDAEHARLEQLAIDAGARLLRVEDDGNGVGNGGGNKTLTSWLMGSLISAR